MLGQMNCPNGGLQDHCSRLRGRGIAPRIFRRQRRFHRRTLNIIRCRRGPSFAAALAAAGGQVPFAWSNLPDNMVSVPFCRSDICI